MKILVLGAGATGGYFGGRLAAAGVDVTFLVRPARAETLAGQGLKIESPRGALSMPVKTVTADQLKADYDAIILSSKAYDLASSIDAIRPAVGADTVILPLYNGFRQLEVLDAAFGKERVLGGTCHISVMLGEDGVIHHFTPFDALTLGPRTAGQAPVARDLHAELSRGGFEARFSDDIESAMWEKWVFLATLAGMTCLMRANIGEIASTADGAALSRTMFEECCAIAAAHGHTPRAEAVELSRSALTDPASKIAASMLRDLERGARIEADHIVGDLIGRGAEFGLSSPLLGIAYTHLQGYQHRLRPAS